MLCYDVLSMAMVLYPVSCSDFCESKGTLIYVTSTCETDVLKHEFHQKIIKEVISKNTCNIDGFKTR